MTPRVYKEKTQDLIFVLMTGYTDINEKKAPGCRSRNDSANACLARSIAESYGTDPQAIATKGASINEISP